MQVSARTKDSLDVTDLIQGARGVPVGDDCLCRVRRRAILGCVLTIRGNAHVHDALRRGATRGLANVAREAVRSHNDNI